MCTPLRSLLSVLCLCLLGSSVASAVPYLSAKSVTASVMEGKDATFDVEFFNGTSSGLSLKVKSIEFSSPVFLSGDKDDRISQILAANDKVTGTVIAPDKSGSFSIVCKTVDDGAPFDDGNGMWEFTCRVVYQWIVDGVEPTDSSHRPEIFMVTVLDPKKVPESVSSWSLFICSFFVLVLLAAKGETERCKASVD